jgi:hypothetical protein
MNRRIQVLLAIAALLACLPVAVGAKGPIRKGTLVVLCERDGEPFADATVFVDGKEAGRGPVVRVTVMAGAHKIVAGRTWDEGRYLAFSAPGVTVGDKQTIVVCAALEEVPEEQATALAFALAVRKTHDWDGRDVKAMTVDGRVVASVATWENKVRLDEIRDDGTARHLRTLEGRPTRIWDEVAFSRDGRLVAAWGTIYDSFDRVILVWNVSSGEEVATFVLRGANVTSLALSPDGAQLAAGFDPPSVRIWDVGTRELVSHVTGLQKINGVRTLQFSLDGRTIAMDADELDATEIAEVATGRSVRRVPGRLFGLFGDERFATLERRPARKGAPYELSLWSPATGAPSESRAVTSWSDPYCRAWPLCVYGRQVFDWRTGELLWTVPAYTVAISEDGTRLVTWSGIYELPVRILRSRAGGT